MGDQDQENEHQKDETFTLSNGAEIPFRTVRPEDAPALQRAIGRCSERTIYLRFFGSLEELSHKKAQYFASTDGIDHFALVALDPEDQNEIIAIVRYDRKPGDERAEYAAIVEDRWQGHGVGTELTRQLINQAIDKGIKFFYALVKGDNKRMLNVLRNLDLPDQERKEHREKHVEVELPTEHY